MSKLAIKDIGGWSFYGCECLRDWWPLVQRMAIKRGLVKTKLDVTQGCYSGGSVSASAGTHDEGGVLDVAQRGGAIDDLLEEAGAAAFERGPLDGMSPHTHLCLIGCPHLQGRPTKSRSYPIGAAKQVTSWMARRNGLANNALDRDQTRPSPIRTWEQGVTWMRGQLGELPLTDQSNPSPIPGESTQKEEELTVAQFDEIMKELATIKAIVTENQARVGVGKGEASIAKRVDLGNAIATEQQVRLGVQKGQTLTGVLAAKNKAE